MPATLAALTPLIGKRCTVKLRAGRSSAIVFDWARISRSRRGEFLDEIFGDWDDPKAFSGVVQRDPKGEIRLADERLVPFALVGVDEGERGGRFTGGSSYPQFNVLAIADARKAGVPVLGLEVDGPAVSVVTVPLLARTLAALAAQLEAKPPRLRKTSTKPAAGTPSPKPGKAADAPPPAPTDYAAMQKASETFQSALFQFTCWTHDYPNKTKAAAWLVKSERALARIGSLVAKSRAYAAEPRIARLPADYANMLADVKRSGKIYAPLVKVLGAHQKFFRWQSPLATFDAFVKQHT